MNLLDFLKAEWDSMTLGHKFLLGVSILIIGAPGLSVVFAIIVLAIEAARIIKKFVELQ